MQENLGLLRSLAIYYGNPLNTRRLRRLYGEFLRPGDLYFDIGAHVGNRIKSALALGARVVAVEPNPQLMNLLNRWYGNNSSVSLIDSAVGSHSGDCTLFVSKRTPTVSTVSKEWMESVSQDRSFESVRWDSAVEVRMTTLDELIGQFGTPQFCKIDIEGYELEALRGLSANLPAISFEYLPTTIDLSIQCISRLDELGSYEYNWSIAEASRLRGQGWLPEADMKAALRGKLREGKSGDIYARLRD